MNLECRSHNCAVPLYTCPVVDIKGLQIKGIKGT